MSLRVWLRRLVMTDEEISQRERKARAEADISERRTHGVRIRLRDPDTGEVLDEQAVGLGVGRATHFDTGRQVVTVEVSEASAGADEV